MVASQSIAQVDGTRVFPEMTHFYGITNLLSKLSQYLTDATLIHKKRTLNRIAIYRTCFFFYLSFDFTFATIVCVFCWSLHCKINLKFLELIGCNTCKCTRIIFKSIRYLHALHHFMCAFYLMSNKRFRFDKKKIGAQETILIERRRKNIEEAAHQSKRLIVCHLPTHIFILVHRKHRNHKTIESNKFMDGFIEKTKPNENNRNLSKRDTNATWRKQYAAFVINERMNNKKWKWCSPNFVCTPMQRTLISQYLCRLYYTIYALLSCLLKQSNWIVCLERVLFFPHFLGY